MGRWEGGSRASGCELGWCRVLGWSRLLAGGCRGGTLVPWCCLVNKPAWSREREPPGLGPMGDIHYPSLTASVSLLQSRLAVSA